MIQHAVHAFTYQGVNIVYDGLSKTLITVDQIGLEVAKRYAEQELSDIIAELGEYFAEQEVRDAHAEIDSLVVDGVLFCDEERFVFGRDTQMPTLKLSGICLHVAHDCNMRCSYCFAGSGLYGGRPTMMESHTARMALDYLFRHAGTSAHVYVDFFGGEPTLNMAVVEDAVAYGNQLAATTGRSVTWSMTTNGLALETDMINFFNTHNVNVIVSMDGREQVHDAIRPNRQGQGTYHEVQKNAQRLFTSRAMGQTNRYGAGVYTYVRGTFSQNNVDFAEDVVHLYRQGFRHIAMEPVVSEANLPWTLAPDHVEPLKEQYDRVVELVLESRKQGDPLLFHHFELDLDGGSCLGKRASGCGAGVNYLAVSPEGDVFPCHQFVGNPSFKMGSVWTDALEPSLIRDFTEANQGRKDACRTCFARYHCGGGCHANHWLLNHDLLDPDSLSCELIRKRLECALFLAVTEVAADQEVAVSSGGQG